MDGNSDDTKLEDESGSTDERGAELGTEDADLLLTGARLALLPLPPPQANNNIHQHTNSARTSLREMGRVIFILFFSPMWLTPLSMVISVQSILMRNQQ